MDAYNTRLAHAGGLRFTEQIKPSRRSKRRESPLGTYDESIAEKGVVPTRAKNWHDYLNMLVWHTFPRAKAALHARQHTALAARNLLGPAARGRRSREEDTLALLDEGGAVLFGGRATSELTAALDAKDDARAEALFRGGACRAVVFGHAVFERLVHGDTSIWAAGFVSGSWPDPTPSALVKAADEALFDALRTAHLLTDPSELLGAPVALLSMA